jgi:hypothetical protein
MRRNDTKKKDALMILARAALADRRRRSPLAILVALAVLVLLGGPLLWWFWPRSALPHILLVAYDQVALPDEMIPIYAQVEPVDADQAEMNLAGVDLYFQEAKTVELLGQIPTQSDGRAVVRKSFPLGQSPAEVSVRYPGEKEHRRGLQASARVFVWPADAALLIVDADHTLAEVGEAGFWTVTNFDIHPQAGAAAVLQKARANYQLVYLTQAADRPGRYRKLRAWLERVVPAPQQFPDGPLLAPPSSGSKSDASAFFSTAVSELKRRFPGAKMGVTKSAAVAKTFQEAGLRTFLLQSAGENVEGVTTLKSWSELGGHLKN